MTRVGIVAIIQESNTFLFGATTVEHFRQDLLLTGDAIRDQFTGGHHEISGFLHGLKDAGITPVPLFVARAMPYGTITAEAFQELEFRLLRAISEAGPLDGILVAPHGATVSAAYPDADGHWLSEVRKLVGPAIPVIGTLDPHGNLSAEMVAATNALIAYRSNPHVDQAARGYEAAALMARTLRGEVIPTQAAAFPPMAINIERQCSYEEPLASIIAEFDRSRMLPGVLSNSLMLGFPYADVSEMGSSTLVVTNNDFQLAQKLADGLAKEMWTHRESLAGSFLSVADAVAQAAMLEGPVCLLDMGDNVGGGSPADGTILLHELQTQARRPAFVCIYDPVAVKQAASVGVGCDVVLSVGGHNDTLHGEPLVASFRVAALTEGRFTEPEARHGGMSKFDQGPTAIVQTDRGLTIMLTTRRMVPFSIRQLTSCGLNPAQFHFIVAKGVNAPLAAYAPVCRNIVRVNTPGVTTADMTTLSFHNRRRPLYPFEKQTAWHGSSRPVRIQLQ